MQQITLTLDLTPENLELLAKLIGAPTPGPKNETKPETKKPAKTEQNKPTETTKTVPAEPDTVEEDKPAAPTEPKEASTVETISKTDVRALALKLSKVGKQDVIKAIFSKFGADKLSDVKEADYPELMKELVKANG